MISINRHKTYGIRDSTFVFKQPKYDIPRSTFDLRNSTFNIRHWIFDLRQSTFAGDIQHTTFFKRHTHFDTGYGHSTNAREIPRTTIDISLRHSKYDIQGLLATFDSRYSTLTWNILHLTFDNRSQHSTFACAIPHSLATFERNSTFARNIWHTTYRFVWKGSIWSASLEDRKDYDKLKDALFWQCELTDDGYKRKRGINAYQE